MDVRSFWLHSSPFHRFQPYYYTYIYIYIYIYIYLLHFCFHLSLVIKKTQMGKWSLISLLKLAVLKLISTKQFWMIWSVTVAVTLVGLFIIGIILFWYSKFRKFCTFLQLSWSNTLSLKSPAIWNFLFDFFVLWKLQFRNYSKGSVNPFGGLYKTLINLFPFFCINVLLK